MKKKNASLKIILAALVALGTMSMACSLTATPAAPLVGAGGGADATEQPSVPVEEAPFGEQGPVEEPPPTFEVSPEQPQEPIPAEPLEAEPAQASYEPAQPAIPAAEEQQTPDWFEAFSQLQQPTEEAAATPPAVPTEEENPFEIFGAEQPSTVTEGEPYEDFTARIRM